MGERYSAAKLALGFTAALALTLMGMALLDAEWLGLVVIALLFCALIARDVMSFGVRGLLLTTGAVMAVIATAFLVARFG